MRLRIEFGPEKLRANLAEWTSDGARLQWRGRFWDSATKSRSMRAWLVVDSSGQTCGALYRGPTHCMLATGLPGGCTS